MHKELRRMPSLDFLRGFEAAGRTLSFTRAAGELFVTQSALSRQVKALEDGLGIALFERRHRALRLTSAGEAFHVAVSDALRAIAGAAERARGSVHDAGVTLTTTVSFASLWIIPRLASFRARHPDVEIYVSADDRTIDLARGEVDVAVRYLAEQRVPEGARRLFGERMLPVAAPALAHDAKQLLAAPRDLARHVLLHLDDAEGMLPWLNWPAWLAANGEPGLKPAGALRFRMYDQLIQAAVAGQGVALGRLPLLADHLRDGRLVAPFSRRFDSARGYYVLLAPRARARPEVMAFVAWLEAEAAAARSASLPTPRATPARRAARAGRR
jgi:LysR family transcriptional regulator, glycine cleavage system transcriptional activator